VIHHKDAESTARQSRKFQMSKSKCQINGKAQNSNQQDWMKDSRTKGLIKFQEIER
jgi:hypothetical protein